MKHSTAVHSTVVKDAFTVIQAGILSLLQDAGRFGKHNIGLSNGGPLDKLSFSWANRLLDNDPNACVIEASFGGLILEAKLDTQIAITGGDAEITINQKVVSNWQTHIIKPGDKIAFGFAKHSTRSYLAVKGGFNIEPMFDSCATVAREKLGGLNGNALQAGDELPCAAISNDQIKHKALNHHDQPEYLRAANTSVNNENIKLRVILGYQQASFSHLDQARFFNNEFTVSDKCDRMGFRLTGPEIHSEIHTKEGGMLSEGICYGAIQIPADGQPIVLLNDRQTIGGYPKIGSVFSLDIPKLTQRIPGTTLSFDEISIDEAQCQLHLAKYRYDNTKLKTLS